MLKKQDGILFELEAVDIQGALHSHEVTKRRLTVGQLDGSTQIRSGIDLVSIEKAKSISQDLSHVILDSNVFDVCRVARSETTLLQSSLP